MGSPFLPDLEMRAHLPERLAMASPKVMDQAATSAFLQSAVEILAMKKSPSQVFESHRSFCGETRVSIAG